VRIHDRKRMLTKSIVIGCQSFVNDVWRLRSLSADSTVALTGRDVVFRFTGPTMDYSYSLGQTLIGNTALIRIILNGELPLAIDSTVNSPPRIL
jgi:hypothetical protein